MSDPVSSPSHYTTGGIETIDAIEAWQLGFHLGNVVKYVSRAGKKDPRRTVEDLRKARWYLDREIDRAEDAASDEDTIEVYVDGLADPIVLTPIEPPPMPDCGCVFGCHNWQHGESSPRCRQRVDPCPCGAGNQGDGHICDVRDPTGYSEGNRAEAPHPPQGDA